MILKYLLFTKLDLEWVDEIFLFELNNYAESKFDERAMVSR
jgi:hypothetical protein